MELRELITVFQKQKLFFIGVVIACVFVAWVWQKEQPMSYEATLLINIGRTGASETTEYSYDSFYRLQADERFADTVVRWLSTPRVIEDVYREANLNPETLGIQDLGAVFEAGRLSSQVISVKYTGENKQALEELAASAVTVLNRYTGTLNTEEKGQGWFVVIGSDPVIRDGRVSLNLALTVGLAVGIFIGFWGALFRNYFSRK